jgi:hypothetical protein
VEYKHDKLKVLNKALNKAREKFKEEFKEVNTRLLKKKNYLLIRAYISRLLALLEQCSSLPARNTTFCL